MPLKRSAAGAEAAVDRTRRQLLEAARAVFTEAGFHRATIREICRRAGANIAAVNYHFGDKEKLYAAVMKETYRAAIEKYPPHFGLSAHPTPEQRLHAFVRSFLFRTLSAGPHAHHGKLMSRELVDPSPALDDIVNEDLRPLAATLMSIVRELLGRKAPEDQVRRCGISVASQILFYHQCQPVLKRLFPDLKLGEADLERLADHITAFSLAAIKKIAGRESER
jgi:TetR/AcrR family transcriptional regulator, regulator of cefoperazone and chloramphenicol sensitivity